MDRSHRSSGLRLTACALLLSAAGCSSSTPASSARGARAANQAAAAGNGQLSATANPPGFGGADGAMQAPMLAPRSPTEATGPAGCLEAVVMFVVDGSGSMAERFGTATRWTALRSALLENTTGFIPRFQNAARFGLMLYDGVIDMQAQRKSQTEALAPMCTTPVVPATSTMPPASSMKTMPAADTCPRLFIVPPKLQNLLAIAGSFPNDELGGSTPTDKALAVAVDQMIASSKATDAKKNPHFIILATDGEPNDVCYGGRGGDGSAQKTCVIQAVDRAAAAGITTYVISLAGDDMKLEQHLVEVAKHGNPKDPSAHTFSPMTPEDLVMTLRTVLTSALGCELQ